MPQNVSDALDNRMRSGGDYPPWWPDDASELDEGEEIVGIIRNIREDPFFDEDDDDSDRNKPAPILEVQTEDELVSTRTHKNLVQLVEDEWDPAVGDLVKIRFAGTYTAEGGTGYNYEMGVISQEDFDEYDIDPSEFTGEIDQEKTESSGSDEDSEPDTMDPEEVAEPDSDDASESDGEIDDEVVQFVEQLMEHNETMDVEELDDYLNEVREFGVDAEEAAIVAGFSVSDGEVS